MTIYLMDNYSQKKIWDEPDDLDEAILLMQRRMRSKSVHTFKTKSGKEIWQIMYVEPETMELESVYIWEEKE